MTGVLLGAVPGQLLAGPAAALEIGQKAPDFALPDLEGRTVRLGRLGGRVVLLDAPAKP